jgi:6-phosphogluconolactonase
MADRLSVYFGTYTEPILFGTGKVLQGRGEGIHLFTLDLRSGSLTPKATIRGIVNPSFLAFSPDGRFLYCVNELKKFREQASGAVSAYAVGADGGLTFLNQQASGGTDPCHVSVHDKGSHVFVANFSSGSVSAFPVNADGSLAEASDFVQHHGSSVDPVRQKGPHAHSVTFDAASGLLFVPDLGLDRLVVYEVDAKRGKLRARDDMLVAEKPGAGPRAFAFHPGGRWAYLINEINSTISAFVYRRPAGGLARLQTVPTLPDGFTGASTCSDVQVTPDGAFLYGSNRGHDSIAGYRIDQASGKLTPIGHTPSGGRTPRGFGIDPSGRYLLAANQDTDDVFTFAIDRASGKLTRVGGVVKVPTPVCVRFLEARSG